MSLSIRWRLTAWIAIALVITLAAIFFSLQFTLSRVLTSDLDSELSRDAGQVTAQLAIGGSLKESELRPIVAAAAAFPLVIRDTDGNVLAATQGLNLDAVGLTSEEQRLILQEGRVVSRTVDIGGEEVRLRSARVLLGREVVGIVQVGESAEAIGQVMRVLTIVLIGGGLGATLLALGVGYWLARSAVRPVERITSLAADIEASDLKRRIEARSEPAEVQRLADTFDAMLARLEAAFQQQRSFVMDVSHELRTPLTALRGNLDVLLMDDRLGGETRAQLERMSAEVGRLIRLTSNLLYLAHVDAGRDLDHRPVELDTLCLEVIHQSRNLRADVTVRLGHKDQVSLSGDRDLLKQLVLNLVDNGLKYTTSGGRVTLSLYRNETQVRLVVEDTGPGIPLDEIPLIFERFYRGPSSHVRSPAGAGIGLAISRWIARAHGGDITVESEVGRGSVFTVVLPLGPASSDGELDRAPRVPPPGIGAAGGTEER